MVPLLVGQVKLHFKLRGLTSYPAGIAPEVDVPATRFLRLSRHLAQGFAFLRLGWGQCGLLVSLPESALHILRRLFHFGCRLRQIIPLIAVGAGRVGVQVRVAFLVAVELLC